MARLRIFSCGLREASNVSVSSLASEISVVQDKCLRSCTKFLDNTILYHYFIRRFNIAEVCSFSKYLTNRPLKLRSCFLKKKKRQTALSPGIVCMSFKVQLDIWQIPMCDSSFQNGSSLSFQVWLGRLEKFHGIQKRE